MFASGCVAINTEIGGAAPTSPASLTYAAPGTQFLLENIVDGARSEQAVTAGPATGLRGAYTNSSGQPGGFYPGCWGCGGTAQIEEDLYARLWPLETGKQVGFLRTSSDGNRARVIIRVAGTERLETPMGDIDTFKLEGRLQGLTGPEYTANVEAWWAPDPGWVIRAVGSDSQGRSLSSKVIAITSP
jgi:hypothetical protein